MTLDDATLDPIRGADIYLIDQLLRGQIRPSDRVLDAGCGGGRNSGALHAMGCDVYGFDQCSNSICSLHSRIPTSLHDHFRVGQLERSPFEGERFDVVICNAVLHFAQHRDHFMRMVQTCWDHLELGGLFFSRLSTTIAWPEETPSCFPFLASESDLQDCESRWGATRADPLKTTLVERARTMTTWVLRKV